MLLSLPISSLNWHKTPYREDLWWSLIVSYKYTFKTLGDLIVVIWWAACLVNLERDEPKKALTEDTKEANI